MNTSGLNLAAINFKTDSIIEKSFSINKKIVNRAFSFEFTNR